jgi:hypothetical protein
MRHDATLDYAPLPVEAEEDLGDPLLVEIANGATTS